MELSVMERYVAFICDELPKTKRVLLNPPPPMETGEYGYTRISKIGPKVYMVTTIEIVETYTRSAKLCIKFEDYQKTDIFYMSRHKGPDKLLDEIDKKIDKIVNKTLIEDGRQEWVREQYKIKSENFPLFKVSPGVKVDVYGDLYEKYETKFNDKPNWGEFSKEDYDTQKMWGKVVSIPGIDGGYPWTEKYSKDEFIDKLKTDEEFNNKWGNLHPGVEIDIYGELYEKYCKIAGNVEEPDYDIHIEDLNQNCTRLMTKDEFIEKLKTDEEFNKKWGGARENIFE